MQKLVHAGVSYFVAWVDGRMSTRFGHFISGKCARQLVPTLTSMNNLALVLRERDKYEQAEEIHRQALGLRETVLGKEHTNERLLSRPLAISSTATQRNPATLPQMIQEQQIRVQREWEAKKMEKQKKGELIDLDLGKGTVVSVYLMGVYLTGVYLIGVHLIGVHLMDMYLINVHLTPHGRASHGRTSHGRALEVLKRFSWLEVF